MRPLQTLSSRSSRRRWPLSTRWLLVAGQSPISLSGLFALLNEVLTESHLVTARECRFLLGECPGECSGKLAVWESQSCGQAANLHNPCHAFKRTCLARRWPAAELGCERPFNYNSSYQLVEHTNARAKLIKGSERFGRQAKICMYNLHCGFYKFANCWSG